MRAVGTEVKETEEAGGVWGDRRRGRVRGGGLRILGMEMF